MDSESLLNMPLDDVVKKLSSGKGGGRGGRGKGGGKGKGKRGAEREGKPAEAKGADMTKKSTISKMDMPLDSLVQGKPRGRRGGKGKRGGGDATAGKGQKERIIGKMPARGGKGRAKGKGKGEKGGGRGVKRVITAAKLQNAGPRRLRVNLSAQRRARVTVGVREKQVVGSQSIQQRGGRGRRFDNNWKGGVAVRPTARRFNFSSQRQPPIQAVQPIRESIQVKKTFVKQSRRQQPVERRPLPAARNPVWQSPKAQQQETSTWGPPPRQSRREARQAAAQQQQSRAQQRQAQPAPARNNYQSNNQQPQARTIGRSSQSAPVGSGWGKPPQGGRNNAAGRAQSQAQNSFSPRNQKSQNDRFSAQSGDRFAPEPKQSRGNSKGQTSFYSHDNARWSTGERSESGKNQRANFRRDVDSRAYADRSNMKQISSKSSQYPTVKVTNIPQEYTRADILGAFKDHFDVQDVIMKTRGTALVLFKSQSEARNAKDQFDGGEMNDHKIRVSWCEPQTV